MKYNKRDLRAVDMFALVLLGTGIVFIAAGIFSYLTISDVISYPTTGIIALILLGIVFLCLGQALNMKLHVVIKEKSQLEAQDDSASGKDETPKKRKLSKTTRYIVVGCVLLGSLLLLLFGPTAVRQQISLRNANRHKDVLRDEFNKHVELSDIRITVVFDEGGCIFLTGIVEDDKAVTFLKQVVAQTNPPVRVNFSVHRNDTGELVH